MQQRQNVQDLPEIVLLYYGVSPVIVSSDEIYHPIIGAQQRLTKHDGLPDTP